MNRTSTLALPLLIAVALQSADAAACGCFAPPIPEAASDSFAVNQQAEQIIFEVQEDTISAHVRILYQGDPEQFAWLLPLPSVPDLELSSGLLFGLVDAYSAPNDQSFVRDQCPQQQYYCRSHRSCEEQYYGADDDGAGDDAQSDGDSVSDAGAAGGGAVDVLSRERIGSYDTVTFAADEADGAIDWLNENGFIINETMSPYMQPYLDEGMVFIASKLVPGADVDEIRPLRMTYEADRPSIPLRLTAIAAEPHMMVTSFIYADREYDPAYVPLVTIPEKELSNLGRSNYPMLLSRIVDEAGGNGFVREYAGDAPVFRDDYGCCDDGEDDWCGVGDDEICQCPGSSYDAADCADDEELVEAVEMMRELHDGYSFFTRLSSRISPEEMSFNPEFLPATEPSELNRNLFLQGGSYSLSGCEDQVIDQDAFEEIQLATQCSAVYCDLGECVVTELGAGCSCSEGAAARVFTDSDGLPSVTCVPDRGTVDFSAGGLDVPDACADTDVDDGECVDVGGFAAVVCDSDKGAALVEGSRVAQCADIVHETGDSGARNHSLALTDLEVCAPEPPTCAADGWLEKYDVERPGVQCSDPPDESWFEVPPEPECGTDDDSSASDDDGDDDDGDDEDSSGDDDALDDDDGDAADQELDTSKPRPEPDAGVSEDDSADEANSDDDSGLFCGVVNVGRGLGAGVIPSGLLFVAALLMRRRRRTSLHVS